MTKDTNKQEVERSETVTAYHEAGHAVIGILSGRIPRSATIVPDGTGMVGMVDFDSDDGPPEAKSYLSDTPAKRAYARSRVLGELAGSAAHDLFEPGRSPDAADQNDDRWSRELIREMVNWEDHDLYFENAQREVKSLLQKNWTAVEAMANALLKYKTMTREQMLAVIQPRLSQSA